MSINGVFGAAVFLIASVAFTRMEQAEPAVICLGVAVLCLLLG